MFIDRHKMQNLLAMQYYSVLKGKENLTRDTTWMNLEDIMLSEISQSQKDKDCMIPFKRGPQNSQIHRDRKQNGGCQGLESGERGVILRWLECQFCKMKWILEKNGDDGGCTTI